MFKIKTVRFAALIFVVTGAAFLVSCQEQGEPTPGALPSEKDYGDIYGNVQDGLGSPIYNAQVTWECMDHDPWINLGTTYSDEDGYYECPPCWFEGHWSHDFRGTAAKTGYVSDVQYIYGWPPYEPPVRVDFTLYAEK